MTNKRRAASVLAIVFAMLCLLAACAPAGKAQFEQREYEVKNGDTVNVVGGKAAYKLIGTVPSGVSVSEDGKFTIESTAPYGSQVVLAAVVDGEIVDTAICKITTERVTPQITFVNRSQYLTSGEQARAVSTPAYSVNYSLKNDVGGISVDEVTGRVTYRGNVPDATPFTIVASALGATAEMQFFAATSNFVTAAEAQQFSEYGVGTDVRFTLQFGDNTDVEKQGVLDVEVGGAVLAQDKYSYDESSKVLTVSGSALANLASGDNTLYIGTAKNTVTVTVSVAKFVRTAADLAAIATGDIEALNSYYVQVEDIDLTDYLADVTAGWFPIGTYVETDAGVVDTSRIFGGHYDGNGHTVSGLWIARQSWQFVEGFNGGLFGYIGSNGIVENLRVTSAEGRESALNSYSGGICGHNCGLVRNCIADVNVVLISEHVNAGGICGMNEGTIENCISLGFVTVGGGLGAVCGRNFNGVISDCYAVDDPNGSFRAGHEYYIFPGRPDKLPAVGTEEGTSTNCVVYSSVEELIASADFSTWTGWTVTPGALPTLLTKTVG